MTIISCAVASSRQIATTCIGTILSTLLQKCTHLPHSFIRVTPKCSDCGSVMCMTACVLTATVNNMKGAHSLEIVVRVLISNE